ncbi:MAG TPA: GNAT family N-acetyltransferase [Thermoanaerobaculia bacterium]|nr:GNAT family N-acetyltransferase [Thermoanaerobaculia bacterium]
MTVAPRKVRLAVRPAEERDVPALQKVAREAWEATYSGLLGTAEREELVEHLYSRRGLREDIARHSSLFFVATVEDAVVGFAELVAEGRAGEVARVAVRPDWQRRGVATTLLRRGLAALAGEGVEAATAGVEVEDEGCRRLFERNGFSATAEPPTELDDYGVELVQFRRRLDSPTDVEAAAGEATIWLDDGRKTCPECHRRLHEATEVCPDCRVTLVAGSSIWPEGREERAPDLVVVLSTSDESRLAFAQEALEGAGIAFAVEGTEAAGVELEVRTVEILVAEAEAEAALELLDRMEELEPATDE